MFYTLTFQSFWFIGVVSVRILFPTFSTNLMVKRRLSCGECEAATSGQEAKATRSSTPHLKQLCNVKRTETAAQLLCAPRVPPESISF